MTSVTPLQSIPINWALTGIAAGFTIARFSIRLYISRGSFTKWSLMDDISHSLSLIFLVVHGFTNTNAVIAKNNLTALVAAEPPAPTAEVLLNYRYRWKENIINDVFLYLTLWLVKFSFLFFYRQLFDISTGFRKAWWVVMVFTFITLWVPLGGIFGVCAGANTEADWYACNALVNPVRAQRLEYTCGIIVASDLAIMGLPLWMLHRMKLRPLQRAGLAFVFSFATVIVAIDILRTAESIAGNQVLYIILEINFSVIIACLPTFRALFNLKGARDYSRNTSRFRGSGLDLGRKFSNWSIPSMSWKSRSNSSNSALESQDRKFAKIADDGHPLRTDVESGPTWKADRRFLPIRFST
ncbi:hypothetical protein MMC13_007515 [Lambiella insularis]|nr:hypothetical protein [Lambiella insularis]